MNAPHKIHDDERRINESLKLKPVKQKTGLFTAIRNIFTSGKNRKEPLRLEPKVTHAVNQKPKIKLVADNEKKASSVSTSVPERIKVSSVSELPKFTGNIAKECKISNELLHRVYPILVDEQAKKFALVFDEAELKHDVFATVRSAVENLGYELAETWAYLAPYSMVFELSKNAKRVSDVVTSLRERSNSRFYVLFENIVKFAVQYEASDIHFIVNLHQAKSRVEFCIHGKMTAPAEFNIGSSDLLQCISYMFNNHGVEVSETVFNQNKSQACNIPFFVEQKDHEKKDLELRFASQPLFNGLLVVLRVTESSINKATAPVRTLESLGYLPDQIEWVNLAISKPKGGMVMCGRVGSGKSTFQHTVLSNIAPERSIITIEDPVENPLPNAAQITVSRALVDEDNYDPFQAAKRQIKRLNPKVVAAGEVRDAATAEVWKDAVEAGLLALCTLHCGSVVEALTLRLVSHQLAIGREVISTPDFLSLVMFQALVRTLCEHCKLPATEVYDDEYLSKIERLFEGLDRKTMCAANKNGCVHCRKPFSNAFNGFSKRIVVAEMLRPDYGMLFLIRNAKNIEIAQRFNMMRGDATFADPSTKGKTALEVAMYHVHRGVFDPKEVEVELGSFDDYHLSKLEQINV